MSESEDLQFMRLAIEQATGAAGVAEVPVGAVLVNDGIVLAKAGNQTIQDSDPTAHAEIIVLRAGAKLLGTPRLTNAILYVTLEPCAMCVGALVQARINRLVFGARESRTGAVVSVFELLMSDQHNHRVAISEGVLADECSTLMRDFFQRRRL